MQARLMGADVFFFLKGDIYTPENEDDNGKTTIWRCISY